MTDELLAQILQSYVSQLILIDSEMTGVTNKILELQAELIDLQKERDETLKLKRDLMKELKNE